VKLKYNLDQNQLTDKLITTIEIARSWIIEDGSSLLGKGEGNWRMETQGWRAFEESGAIGINKGENDSN
jgi:hypothetical protein